MLVAELQELEEVKNLLAKGQQVGVLTFGEIATAVAEVDVDEGDIEELYGHLERSGIELVEDVDPAQASQPELVRSAAEARLWRPAAGCPHGGETWQVLGLDGSGRLRLALGNRQVALQRHF